MKSTQLPLIGYACGNGAGNPDTRLGPSFIQNKVPNLNWLHIFKTLSIEKGTQALNSIAKICNELAEASEELAKKQFFLDLNTAFQGNISQRLPLKCYIDCIKPDLQPTLWGEVSAIYC